MSTGVTSSGAALSPTEFFFRYEPDAHPIEARLARALDWLDPTKDNFDFVLLYYEEPDNTGHLVGPHGTGGTGRELEHVLEHIDELVGTHFRY